MSPDKQWLATLKAGDQVAVAGARSRYEATYMLLTITRVTGTQLVADGPYGREWRIDRANGRVRGTAGAYTFVEPVTKEVLEANEHSELVIWLNGIPPGSINGWKSPPLAVLRAMKAAYDEAVKGLAP